MSAPRCVADDWGMSPGVNEGILELARRGVVRGVSMMANLPHAGRFLPELLAVPGLEYSLHLNFTLGRPVSPAAELPGLCAGGAVFRGLGRLACRAFLGLLDADELSREARAQARLLKGLGVPLTGLEGHHHAHLLPGVCRAAAPALSEEGIRWVRVPADPGHMPSRLLGLAFDRAGLRGVPTLYLRGRDYADAGRLGRKLSDPLGRPVIVHPASRDDCGEMEFHDDYRAGRVAEYERLLAWSGAARA